MSLPSILRVVRPHLPLSSLIELLQKESSVHLSPAVGSLLPLTVHELSTHFPNILVICENHEEAQFFESDLISVGNESALLFSPTFQKPYDDAQISEVSSLIQRSEVVETVLSRKQNIIISSPEGIFVHIPEPSDFQEASFTLAKKGTLDPEKLMESLVDLGYEPMSFVQAPGEFSQRGGLIDVFPFSSSYPVRLEFFGDEIESIREFDPDSQRSISFQDKIRIVPNVEQLKRGASKPLFEFLPKDTLVVTIHAPLVLADLENLWSKAEEEYERKMKQKAEVSAPTSLFCSPESFKQWTQQQQQLYAGKNPEHTPTTVLGIQSKAQPEFNASIKLLKSHIQDLSKQAVDTWILCDTDAQKNRFEDLLGEPSSSLRYELLVGTLHRGFYLPDAGIAIYTDHQVFNRYHRPKSKKKITHRGGLSLKELQDLNVGDYVVHVDYGIGKFSGFRRIKVKGILQESVVLTYKDSSTLYVNVSSLHKLQKYSGKDGALPQITKLGSGEWAKKKAKTKSRLKDIAKDLIELYAKRKAQQAFAFPEDTNWEIELEASFMYEETPDQKKAIEEVKTDMKADFPMDRLVCGDVGFGKTEVAVRAAFKAVMGGKQVAVLVPTTILADQHLKTFESRMKNFPVRVESISRFKSTKEQKEVLKKVKTGEVDILIGTHRITSKDVHFKDLGLLIVDEEQRFGVAMKEKLKTFRAAVDVLTLTATPIPRTLHLSLIGARDLSIISTPPPNRQPVYTEIHSYDERLIRDVIMQEISRGGQIFFIHNRVKNIAQFADIIRGLVPNVRVRHAHGQMTGKELEHIITDFYHHKFDVLLSTNIVENGIDISNANTIIINRADHFGLSELHQLRGRVGRSNKKAYCYLITPPFQELSMDSRKRLMALEEYSDLGSGFNIAMRDLDIRGAGDVLGAEQSGFINELGYDLYMKILNDAVRELKESNYKGMYDDIEVAEELPETTVEMDVAALLPQSYVLDNVERLNLYRKLATAETLSKIKDWEEELEDRFGKLPIEVKNLRDTAILRLMGSSLFIDKIIIRAQKMWLQCPKFNSTLGKKFYDEGKFQLLTETLQTTYEDRLSMIQKDDAVRFVVKNVPTLSSAIDFFTPIADVKEDAHISD